jgi:hypothetical protein
MEGWGKSKNRSRSLAASSMVPQPTALQRVPPIMWPENYGFTRCVLTYRVLYSGTWPRSFMSTILPPSSRTFWEDMAETRTAYEGHYKLHRDEKLKDKTCVCCLFHAMFIPLPWRWRRHFPSKHRLALTDYAARGSIHRLSLSIRLHGVVLS